jgi:hypothetical protein
MLLTRTTRIQSRPKSPQDASSNPYLPPWYIALPCSNGRIDNLSMVKVLFALRAVHHSRGIGRLTNTGREYTLRNLWYIVRNIYFATHAAFAPRVVGISRPLYFGVPRGYLEGSTLPNARLALVDICVSMLLVHQVRAGLSSY